MTPTRTIGTAPTCKATIQGAAASVTTNPGAYLGAITCAGAADANYTIGYASAKLTVNPVIRLDQTGLPAALPKRATIDGQVVTLPTGDVEVGYGTAHSYSFPARGHRHQRGGVHDHHGGAPRPDRHQPHRHRELRHDGERVAAAVASGGIDRNRSPR